MGASRSLPIWKPLSLNCWQKVLSFGQASWQEEQGMPYFRAKAGRAFAWWQSVNRMARKTTEKIRPVAARRRSHFTSIEQNCSILPPPNVWRQRWADNYPFNFEDQLGGSVLFRHQARRASRLPQEAKGEMTNRTPPYSPKIQPRLSVKRAKRDHQSLNRAGCYSEF